MLSFLCNLDNFLSKNVIVFILGKQILKWRSFEKKKNKQNKTKNKTKQNKNWPPHHIFSHQANDIKIPAAHSLLVQIQLFSSPFADFFPY